MKKTLITCVAVAILLAVAGSASAITCTVDKRPAATLLVPYFEASFNPDGTIIGLGAASRDTLVTIANASSQPMIAHVNVWNKRSELVLDFNIALTGFDVQAFSMAAVISGKLPRTGRVDSSGTLVDACQRTGSALNAPFLRIGAVVAGNPPSPATTLDNTLATTLYASGGAFSFADAFGKQVLDSLDQTTDTATCGGVDGVISGPATGYVTIDHANYCNLSNPSDPAYYLNDAIGMENNLWGDVIFTSGAGVGTYGGSMVHIEADPSLFGNSVSNPRVRTFYARYVTADTLCTNCAQIPAIDQGIGDQREPLGLKYAARWFDSAPTVTSNFTVWRASSGSLTDLLGTPVGKCTDVEPTVSLTFYDEDERPVTSGTCPSPCTQPTFNFPLETQHSNIGGFSHPAAAAGWVNMSFFNGAGPNAGSLDQAYVLYDFVGAAAFLSMQENAAQLDPSSCNPLNVSGVKVITPVIPLVVGTGS